MRIFRLHLQRGLSGEQYRRLAARLGICRKVMTPVRVHVARIEDVTDVTPAEASTT